MSRRAWIEVVVLIALSATLYSITTSRDLPWLSHEGRHAQIAREMLERGSFAAPVLLGEPYHQKPPLFYWSSIAIFELTGEASLRRARLVGVGFGVLGVLALYGLARSLLGERDAFLAALLLALSPAWVREAAAARTDMPTAALCAVAAALLWNGLRPGAAGWRAAMSLALGGCATALSLLAKTPIAALILPAAFALYFVLSRSEPRPTWRALLIAPCAFLLTTGSWALATVIAGQGDYLHDLVFGTGLAKAWRSYPRPPWYYLGVFPARFLPLSIFLPATIAHTVALWKSAEDPAPGAARLTAVLLVTGILILSLLPSKRGQYLLPLYPFAALHVAFALGGWLRAEVPIGLWLERRVGTTRLPSVTKLLLVLFVAAIFAWRGAGLFVHERGAEPLLAWIRTNVAPTDRLAVYGDSADSYAIEWPTLAQRVNTRKQLKSALAGEVEYVLTTREFSERLPAQIQSRLLLVASEARTDGQPVMELFRVFSGTAEAMGAARPRRMQPPRR